MKWVYRSSGDPSSVTQWLPPQHPSGGRRVTRSTRDIQGYVGAVQPQDLRTRAPRREKVRVPHFAQVLSRHQRGPALGGRAGVAAAYGDPSDNGASSLAAMACNMCSSEGGECYDIIERRFATMRRVMCVAMGGRKGLATGRSAAAGGRSGAEEPEVVMATRIVKLTGDWESLPRTASARSDVAIVSLATVVGMHRRRLWRTRTPTHIGSRQHRTERSGIKIILIILRRRTRTEPLPRHRHYVRKWPVDGTAESADREEFI